MIYCALLFITAIFILWLYALSLHARLVISPYPDGKKFAFTIIDDTDGETLETIKPIYDFLLSIGLKTTKTVWVHSPSEPVHDVRDTGDTTEREDYLAYLQRLQQNGFEIALHNVSSRSNKKQEIARGIETFKKQFGHYPYVSVSHEKNKENIYFEYFLCSKGMPQLFRTKTLSLLYRCFYVIREKLMRQRPATVTRPRQFWGEIEGSDYFWGNICREKIRYVRSYVFHTELNTLRYNPGMPYHLDETPYVNSWFDSSNGQDCEVFNHILSERNLRRLKWEGGTCILFTHFGKGFITCKNGSVVFDEQTQKKLKKLAQDTDGWYAPVNVILDRLHKMNKVHLCHIGGNVVVHNAGEESVMDIMLLGKPNAKYYDSKGKKIIADKEGRIFVPILAKEECRVLLNKKPRENTSIYWRERQKPLWLVDLHEVWRKINLRVLD